MNAFAIRDKLRSMWPGLRHIWPWDKRYLLITPRNLQVMSDKIRKAKIVFPDGTTVVFGDLANLGDFWDCDDFACGAEFLMKLLWKLTAEQKGLKKTPIAYGQARGAQFRGMPGLHALNHCMTIDGVYFNDHDDGGRVWKATKQDLLFYVSI